MSFRTTVFGENEKESYKQFLRSFKRDTRLWEKLFLAGRAFNGERMSTLPPQFVLLLRVRVNRTETKEDEITVERDPRFCTEGHDSRFREIFLYVYPNACVSAEMKCQYDN